LSYTSFAWTDIGLDKDLVDEQDDGVTISLQVTNTGERAGSDVVQVYRADRTGVVLRPRRELVGFAKVRLRPGETRHVTVRVPARAFAYFDIDEAQWLVPRGEFDLEVARSSEDVVQTLALKTGYGVSTSGEPPATPAVSLSDGDFSRRLRRPVPKPRPVRPITRDSTLGDIKTTPLGALLKAAMWKATPIDDATKADPSAMRMLDRSLDELPLRGAALLGGGKLSWSMLDAMIDALNKHPARAAVRVLRPAARKVGQSLSGAARALGGSDGRRPPR
jgi:beta-glucosidase